MQYMSSRYNKRNIHFHAVIELDKFDHRFNTTEPCSTIYDYMLYVMPLSM